jgi:hypothetical protein
MPSFQGISPRFMVNLKKKIIDKINAEFKYQALQADFLNRFGIKSSWDTHYNKHKVLNLFNSLSKAEDSILFQMAVDLGLEVPGLIYSVAEIRDILGTGYTKAHSMFENAYKKVMDEPSQSVILANSALESILKELSDEGLIEPCRTGDSLKELTNHVITQLDLSPSKMANTNMKKIVSKLLKIAEAIQNLRSEHTEAHGKNKDSYLIDNPMYSQLVLNAVTTVGLFLHQYHQAKANINNENQFEESITNNEEDETICPF